ncbi:MAG: hypothetical protein ACD_2C00198G0001 [uncultured bacterium (gcode 4)]|uniref:Protease PrsW n=1 Tax=uncultured bacterium (gcode 4) TaxID=1234023 RepID=K2G226_9BACT|nr:MAG: hypothetical protein ACD_2C00198G0001 [uncultured bacterium (gcode 4)]
MDNLLSYWILIAINIAIVFFLWWLWKRPILLLILWWWILLILLQLLYMWFWSWIHINLIIFKIDLQINNFIDAARGYFDSSGLRIWKIWFFSVLFSFILPAFLEEFWKYQVLKLMDKKLKVVKSVVFAIVAISYVAIGFALFETMSYIYFSKESFNDLMKIAVVRWIISTSSHVFFSIIVAYYYGKALFLKFEIIDNLEISKTTKMLKRFKKIPFININSISRYYYLKYMLTWFFLSITLHAFYNAFWELEMPIYAIFTVMIWIAIFLKLIFIKKHNKNYMDLKNKIQYLKEMKELKERVNENRSVMRSANPAFIDRGI